MSDSSPPAADVRRLIELLETYEHLHALLLLFQARGREWTVAELRDPLKIDSARTTVVVGDLVRFGLAVATPEDRFRFDDRSADLTATVGRLAELYAENPVSVIRELTNNAIERVRTRALRTFSDAFVLGSKKNG